MLYDQADPLIGIYSGELNTRQHKYLHVSVHSSFSHNSQKLNTIQHLPLEEWKNNFWYIYTTEYYTAMKINELLIHATTWLTPRIIMLSERSVMPLMRHSRKGKTIGTENRSVDWEGSWRQRDTRELLGADGGGYVTVYICQNSSNYTYKGMNFIVYKLYLI